MRYFVKILVLFIAWGFGSTSRGQETNPEDFYGKSVSVKDEVFQSTKVHSSKISVINYSQSDIPTDWFQQENIPVGIGISDPNEDPDNAYQQAYSRACVLAVLLYSLEKGEMLMSYSDEQSLGKPGIESLGYFARYRTSFNSQPGLFSMTDSVRLKSGETIVKVMYALPMQDSCTNESQVKLEFFSAGERFRNCTDYIEYINLTSTLTEEAEDVDYQSYRLNNKVEVVSDGHLLDFSGTIQLSDYQQSAHDSLYFEATTYSLINGLWWAFLNSLCQTLNQSGQFTYFVKSVFLDHDQSLEGINKEISFEEKAFNLDAINIKNNKLWVGLVEF